MKKPNIYNYLCPHEYLYDVWLAKKKRNPAFSVRAWSRLLQVPFSSLNFVLTKERAVSRKLVFILVESLGLSDHEADYFCSLVDLSLQETDEGRRLFRRKLARLSSSHLGGSQSFAGVWYGESHIIGRERAIPRPFKARQNVSLNLAMSRNQSELLIESDGADGQIWHQFVPENRPLDIGKPNQFVFEYGHGREHNFYQLKNLSDEGFHVSTHWHGEQGKEKWSGLWETSFRQSQCGSFLTIQMFVDGSEWGKNGCYLELQREGT